MAAEVSPKASWISSGFLREGMISKPQAHTYWISSKLVWFYHNLLLTTFSLDCFSLGHFFITIIIIMCFCFMSMSALSVCMRHITGARGSHKRVLDPLEL